MTKSATATPDLTERQVSTVNIDGSWGQERERHTERGRKDSGESEREHIQLLTAWSNDTALMTMKLLRSYLYG